MIHDKQIGLEEVTTQLDVGRGEEEGQVARPRDNRRKRAGQFQHRVLVDIPGSRCHQQASPETLVAVPVCGKHANQVRRPSGSHGRHGHKLGSAV
jgi:hypothetical protein